MQTGKDRATKESASLRDKTTAGRGLIFPWTGKRGREKELSRRVKKRGECPAMHRKGSLRLSAGARKVFNKRGGISG